MSADSEKFSAKIRSSRSTGRRIARPSDSGDPAPDKEAPDLGAGARGGGPDAIVPPSEGMNAWLRKETRRPPPRDTETKP